MSMCCVVFTKGVFELGNYAECFVKVPLFDGFGSGIFEVLKYAIFNLEVTILNKAQLPFVRLNVYRIYTVLEQSRREEKIFKET